MDTITQGLLGAAAAQAVVSRPDRRAWIVGGLGGMAADVDILFELARDPMLGLHLHRHFTHALAFIPLGALAVALPFLLRVRDREIRRRIVVSAMAGYATHGPLDAFTSYGTVLLWPFSEVRIAFDCLAIVDPLVSVALLSAVVLAARRGVARPARIGLGFLCLYIGLGAVQRTRAVDGVRALAASRGHAPDRIRAFPLVLSNIRWRVMYVVGDTVDIAGVTVPWVGETRVRAGASFDLVREADLPADVLDSDAAIAAFRRYRWFTDGFVGRWPGDDSVLGDLRYSSVPRGVAPMWGIRFRPGADIVTELVTSRPTVREVLDGVRGDGR